MAYDEVCLLCGIRPEGGPVLWYSGRGLEEEPEVTRIADELLEFEPGPSNLPREEIVSMLMRVFDMELDSVDPYYDWAVFSGYERDCIAIGHFGDDDSQGYLPCVHHGRRLHPTGEGVQMRRVRSALAGGFFIELVEFHGGKRVAIVNQRVAMRCTTNFSDEDASSCNIWVHIACWSYLQEWLNCPLPPRIGRSGRPLSFAGELYELVGSRYGRQMDRYTVLPCIDYGGPLGAYMGYNRYQDYILGCRKGVKHLARALKEGLRDEQLIPAIFKDCDWWKFVRPDIWPRAPHPGPFDPNPVADVLGIVPQPQALLCQLPNELLPELLQHFCLQDIFALASTCKDLYTRLLDHNTLICVVRNAIANVASPLHWIIPLRELHEEWMVAYDAMATWMPPGTPPPPTFVELEFPEDEADDEDYIPPDDEEYSDEDPCHEDQSESDDDSGDDGDSSEEATTDEDEGIIARRIVDVPVPRPSAPPPPALLLLDPAFPLLTFLRAYRDSDSMRARQRRWELIKQFDVLFTNYRRDGWERDDFCLPGTMWVPDGRSLRCQCAAEQPP
ncbi:hypothetical protein GY45DRAFT_1323399 [Cubamyces sp. BRFM 1775]|nr:hypothetical protein GY45DRAFT_1323399 [Cubamyces sp. BRFM 1775]